MFDRSGFVPVVFFDEGNKFIWFDEVMAFFPGMEHEDVSVRFYLREEYPAFIVDVFNKICRSIPCIEGNIREFNAHRDSMIEDLFCESIFDLKSGLSFLSVNSSSGRYGIISIEKRLVLETNAETTAALHTSSLSKRSTVLILSALV